MAAKKKSEIQELSEFIRDHMAAKKDIRELRDELRGEFNGGFKELKGDIVRLSEQVTSIEGDIRGMKRSKLEFRVADLEEKVFGESRA
jgi:predicted  nucleic acid-binding Zn-ribbon protein